jgi:SAM-dependent methyltransferase
MTCPLCADSHPTDFHKDLQREYLLCQICHLVYVPDQYILNENEERKIYDLHENNVFDQGYRKFLSRVFTPLNDQLKPKSSGLEFGCGPGPTLAEMFKEAGHDIALYDKFYFPDKTVLEKSYDFISCTEVIEHVKNPNDLIELFSSILNDQGIIGIMTKLVMNQEAFKTWHYKNDPTHIRFFSESTFQWIAQKYKWQLSVLGKDVILLNK